MPRWRWPCKLLKIINLDQEISDALPVPGASVQQAGPALVSAGINIGSGADQKSNDAFVTGRAPDDKRRPAKQQEQ